MLRAGLRHIARKQEVERRYATTRIPGREKLILAIIEGKRQHRECNIVALHLEVMRHAHRTEPEIGVAEHHTFGSTRRAAGVEDCRQLIGIRL